MEASTHNIQDLLNLLLMAWCQIPQRTFRGLVEPMPQWVIMGGHNVTADWCIIDIQTPLFLSAPCSKTPSVVEKSLDWPTAKMTEDLENKVLVFPKGTNTAHVILRPTITRPLKKVSVCLRSYTDLSRPYTPFSLATPGKDNAFLIFLQPPNTCSIFINQELTNFKTDAESLDWRHICVTWDSKTGLVQLWVNGKLYPRRVSMKGSSIATETSIVLGQEQDSFGGGFDASQSLVGEISDVHMWDYVLTPRDVKNVISGSLHGNVIHLKSVVYEIKGEVLIQPKP